ncbi:MAG TPA: aminomethyl-transferring glycine dehydrogenase subunit GcvPB [Bacteroidaceae bacterium]|nr:aminomethyl-transferring glycine dehydrogenase subunit GcvPB [Bacteroidaceae bacterium]
MKKYDTLIFELSKTGRKGFSLPKNSFSEYSLSDLPNTIKRVSSPNLPEVDEPSTVRHYTNLSNMNFGVDTGFYPLGSCTMKYNPKINEEISEMTEFSSLHPLQPEESVQGALELYYNLAVALSEIAGLHEFTLNPFAGAHGELTGLMIMRQYHIARGDTKRIKIIVPDSAHGTNPASATVCGLEIVEVKSNSRGTIDLKELELLLDNTVAGIMMTNPNTLGVFEKEIPEIARMVHNAGGLLYYDGANMNPLMGKCRPGDMGFDIMHFNLHKSFSTPHGGGGPGSGPVGVRKGLEHFLPTPHIIKKPDGTFGLETGNAYSIGQISKFTGNYGVLIKTYTYILSLGKEHIKNVGPLSVLNANYIKESLKDIFELPIEGVCAHEFVFDGLKDKSTGVTTLDVAKRLLDYGYHAPTIYFPLLFHQSIMIEPTETESKETLDSFIQVMRQIAEEAISNPDIVKTAPHFTPVQRLDELLAARRPIVKFTDF